jgi:hypothetical protein
MAGAPVRPIGTGKSTPDLPVDAQIRHDDPAAAGSCPK